MPLHDPASEKLLKFCVLGTPHISFLLWPRFQLILSPGIFQMPSCDQTLKVRTYLEKEAVPSPEECNGFLPNREANDINLPNLFHILGFVKLPFGFSSGTQEE